MVKVNELRMGNLVNWQVASSIYQGEITSISTNVVVVDHKSSFKVNSEDEYYHINPIPLTEDWLLKFGFKTFKKDWSKKSFIVHSRKRGFIIRKSIPQIEYVHQLQNIYFALTGEELIIK